MKEITSTVYKAFDGKEFTDSKECGQYEFEITKDLTLKTFDVNIPLEDDFCTYTAYLINNEIINNIFSAIASFGCLYLNFIFISFVKMKKFLR